MRIHVLSDLHMESDPGAGPGAFSPESGNADVVVLAGDIFTQSRSAILAGELYPDKPVVMVAGNHEHFGRNIDNETRRLKNSAPSNVHVLENDEVIIDGVRFAGGTLWTDYKLFNTPVFSKLLSDSEFLSKPLAKAIKSGPNNDIASAQALLKRFNTTKRFLEAITIDDRPTVVVTHHAPSERSIAEEFKGQSRPPLFASHLDDLVAGTKAKLWIHGHVHSSCDYKINQTRVIANPKGHYRRENKGFQPTLVVDI